MLARNPQPSPCWEAGACPRCIKEPELPRPSPPRRGHQARRRPQGWRLWGPLADFDDLIDFYDFLRLRGIIDDDSSEGDELDDYVEHLDNRRW
jgi:hypothetical protein